MMRDNVLWRGLRHWEGILGAGLLLIGALAALLAPVLLPGDPLDMVARPLLPPFADSAALLGTDRLGRSILAGLVHGARWTLVTAALVASLALAVGAFVGAVAGYRGGLLDEALMRLADATQAVPSFVLALALVSVLGPSQSTLVVALAAAAWTAPSRVVRAEVMTLRSRQFVEASRLIGRSQLAIALRVVLPNALHPLIALAAVIIGSAILAEAALSFLGLGDPNAASWGAMIAEGRVVIRSAPHVMIVPGLAVMSTVLAVSLLGEGLAKALQEGSDP